MLQGLQSIVMLRDDEKWYPSGGEFIDVAHLLSILSSCAHCGRRWSYNIVKLSALMLKYEKLLTVMKYSNALILI